MSEVHRRVSNRDKALALLQQHGRVSNFQLWATAGVRAGARILELRRQGWRIRTEQKSATEFEYVYEGPPLPPVDQELPL